MKRLKWLGAFAALLWLGSLMPTGCVAPLPPASNDGVTIPATSRSTSGPTSSPTTPPTNTPVPTSGPTDTPSPTPKPLPSPMSTATKPTPSPDPLPTATEVQSSQTIAPSPTMDPATTTPASPTPLPTPAPTVASTDFVPVPPEGRSFASLDDFWAGSAEWMLEAADVGLPAGESDTVHRGAGEFWSYLHASYESAGVVDSCGAPAPFPGCVTLWKSHDGGLTFSLEAPVCLFPCGTCPCDSGRDHTGQQQYPRVFFGGDRAYMVYEWGAATYLRTSPDGVHWSSEAHVPETGQWDSTTRPCTETEAIGEHPNIYDETEFGDCLVGAPPGIYAEGNYLFVFVGLGRDPGHMGCYVGGKASVPGAQAALAGLRKCASNPLFGAENGYGPVEAHGAEANPYFEFRTISSADVVRVGERYYMAYEGVRGPSDPAMVDDQFALGLARSLGPAIDGPWERYPDNPIITDVANNWGIGHGDLVIVGPATYLYTAASQTTRGRYVLVRR